MSAVEIEVKLSRASKEYSTGEPVRGLVVVQCRSQLHHDGLAVAVVGTLELSRSHKQLQLLHVPVQLQAAGQLPAGRTELPFEVALPSSTSCSPLYDTYHGVLINVRYCVCAELRRGLLAKEARHSQEFTLRCSTTGSPGHHAVNFVTAPSQQQGDLRMRGRFDSVHCMLQQALSGHLIVERSAHVIDSVELQLMRVETVSASGASHTSQVQSIQVAVDDPPRNIPIPLHMMFPRLFTCSSVDAAHFQLQFSVSVVVVLEGGRVLADNFPLVLYSGAKTR